MSYYGNLGEGCGSALTALVTVFAVLVPLSMLGLWKLCEIVWWVLSHIEWVTP